MKLQLIEKYLGSMEIYFLSKKDLMSEEEKERLTKKMDLVKAVYCGPGWFCFLYNICLPLVLFKGGSARRGQIKRQLEYGENYVKLLRLSGPTVTFGTQVGRIESLMSNLLLEDWIL